MKMKRMFSKKKKPAVNTDVIYDSNLMETIDESPNLHGANDSQNNPKANGKKKQRQRKKRKAQKTQSTAVPNNDTIAYQNDDGTRVTLRRGSGVAEDQNPLRNHGAETKRIPGSESSSRTASSASSSSSSSRPWSTGRPWSLIESHRGQSLSDLTNPNGGNLSINVDHPSSAGRNATTPSICTMPRGMTLKEQEESFGKNGRSRTFTLDFNFFRRFKRPATSPAASTNKRLSASHMVLPQFTKDRQPFSIMNIKKGRKLKKQKSENDESDKSLTPSQMSYESADLKSISADIQSLDRTSVLEQSEDSISHSTPKHSCSGTSSSRGSVSTVVSASDVALLEAVSRRSSLNREHSGAKNDDASRCHKCDRLRSGFRRSVCYCNSASETPLVSSASQPRMSQAAVSPVEASLNLHTSNSYTGLGEDKSGKATNSGSMSDFSFTLDASSAEDVATSAETSKAKASKFHTLSTKGSVPYASSPQVNISRMEVVDTQKHRERSKASSVKMRFSGEITARSHMAFAPMSLLNVHPTVAIDSPIKRAIAYPGVVMRRQQNREQGKKRSNASSLVKSSSGDMMRREDRAMQVLSLNVEDLPTYGMTREEARWRRSTISAKERLSVKLDDYSSDSRFAQQYAAHFTSADDVRKVHEFEMDDDEFLNYSLDPLSAKASLRDRSRTSPQEVASISRVKNLRKSVASFAHLISPGKPGKKIQRSPSFKESAPPVVKPYRPPGSANGGGGTAPVASYRPPGKRGKGNNLKQHRSKLWCETFDRSGIDDKELKRQEAIFELYQGERVMVEDLKMAKQTYRDSMVTLKMLSEDEVNRIFGKLDCLLPLHEDLLARLEAARMDDGRTEEVSCVFLDWFPSLSPYDEYCANQADAKETLDAVVSREVRVRDFLQRCLESPFSRKLDLWSYLDLPRSRLVKYPLLLKAILKVTPPEHPDSTPLEDAIDAINATISRVDNLTGERQARFVKSKLEYLDEKKRCPEVEISRKIVCSGQLKNSRGSKLQVFLFDHALVLTRNATRGEKLTYQVYRQPVALKTLLVETEEGGKLSGSFRGGLLSSDKAKHSFRVKSETANISYTLVATDEHDKKQWVNSIQEAINKCRLGLHECATLRPPTNHAGSSEKSNVLTSAVAKLEKKMSVKRSSSVKSDNGSSWYRNRSLTANGFAERRGSKKKDKEDEKSKQSSLPRYSNKPSILDFLSNSSERLHRKHSLDEKSDIFRSRSLTSSPITFLTSLPKRKQKNGASLIRSESCRTKPPSGRLNWSRSSTRPKSPTMGSTRSIPDLYSYERIRSNSEHSLTLEAVKNRLAQVESKSTMALCESLAEESVSTSCSPEGSIDSPNDEILTRTFDSDAVSATNFDSSEESHSSTQVDMSSSSLGNSSPSESTPSLENAPPPTWTSLDDQEDEGSSAMTSSTRSSFTSLGDALSGIEDMEMQYDKGTTEDTAANCNDCGGVIAPTDGSENSDIAMILNEMLNKICDSFLTCNSDYVTITNDDGLPWDGRDIEITV